MIQVRNNAVVTTPLAFAATSTIIPFDTISLNTNDLLALSNNTIKESVPGVFETECTVTLQNAGSAAVSVTLSYFADGAAVTGATAQVTIPAAAYATVTLPWAVNVKSATSGVATSSWYLSGGVVNLCNAVAQVKRIV